MDPRKLNESEKNMLGKWEDSEYLITQLHSRIFVTRKFYDFMQAILAECYVNFADFVEEKSWYIYSRKDDMWYMGNHSYTDNILSAKIYKTTHGAIAGVRALENSHEYTDLLIKDENGKELMF